MCVCVWGGGGGGKSKRLGLVILSLKLEIVNLIISSGLEVIKLEYSLRLKIALYFESENELKFYNLKAWCV